MRLIDADAFKEYICNAYEQVKHMYPDGGEWARQITEDFCKDIDEQPTIEPQEWIPCSERLPEYEEYVLVTFIDKSAIDTKVMCVRRIERFADWYWSDFANEYTWEESEVIAWMPLPDPWKEGQDETNRCG